MLTLIENGNVYAPEPVGKHSILLGADEILKIGAISRRAIEALDVEFEIIDAGGCIITPGFIDPHEHLLGGSGEKGFATQTPEIYPSEIVRAGITTVVGCLGVDTTMKTLAGLLAKVKALKEEGLSAFMWTGGYDVPPNTITGTARDDIMFVEEIIGAGEIAISDERSTDPQAHELARLASDAHNGGMLSKKAGVTHFHVGSGAARLKMLVTLIDDFDVKPEWLYPTHITRSEELMREAIDLVRRGSFADIDTVDEDLPKQFKFYVENGGALERLTVSTDASITSPQNLLTQIRACVLENKISLEQILPCVSRNTARVLRLEKKGELMEGKAADVLIFDEKSFVLRDVICGGRRLLKDGTLDFKEAFLEESNREIKLAGSKKSGDK